MSASTVNALSNLVSANDELNHALHFADALQAALVDTTPEIEAALNMVLAGLTDAVGYVNSARAALHHA
jgi:hypothetical protein